MTELFETSFTAQGVWIGFDSEPTIASIQEARRLLDDITDDLIRKAINHEQ
jgi:hypothetical protein